LAVLGLAGPTVLAFFTGGYFNETQAWAGLVAWALVAAAAIVLGPRALPRAAPVWWAIGGLAGLAAWTLLSMTWALVPGYAYHAGQLAMLYLGALVAGTLLLRSAPARRLLEPALVAGTVVVIGYGLSERLLPGLLSFQRSFSAGGRLEQPLTYWNAMGELAAIGFVLSARLAGDRSREVWLRALSAAAAGPLGLGLYLSFSRGALFAAIAGIVSLVVLVARAEQFRSLAVAIGAALVCSGVSAPFAGLTNLSGSRGTRESQGAVVLAVLAVVCLAAGALQARLATGERTLAVRLARWAPGVAALVISLTLALAIVLGTKETSKAPLAAGASRLTTLRSDRYDYWRVALRAFGDQPLHGIGAENWWLYWLHYRHTNSDAHDAHSLELQTLAELGIVGELMLIVLVGGVAVAARRGYREAPEAVAGLVAGAIVWLVHSPLDWDWQMPAVTLVAVALAGGLLARTSAVASAR
jgi:hypothetical protein